MWTPIWQRYGCSFWRSYLYTNNKDQTVTLSYNFPAIVRMVAYDRSVSVHAEVCALPQKLQLSVECLVNGDHQWTVTNNNAKAITFDWASDNSIDSGTGLSVGGNGGTQTFTSNYEAQEVTLTYNFAGEMASPCPRPPKRSAMSRKTLKFRSTA